MPDDSIILSNCCHLKSPHAPPTSALERGAHVYIQVGSPTTHHALAVRFSCPNCGMTVLRIDNAFPIDQPEGMWGKD